MSGGRRPSARSEWWPFYKSEELGVGNRRALVPEVEILKPDGKPEPDAGSFATHRIRCRTTLACRSTFGCHTFRATGITAYLKAGGTLENARTMAAHESPRTTKLYNRTADVITFDEIEPIVI